MTKERWNASFESLISTEFVYNKFNSLTIQAQREKLPIFKYRSHLLFLLEQFQSVVVIGETGSGKSTQIPQYLIESGWPGQIAVTQPRRVAAVSLAKRVATETGTIVQEDDMVGYAVKWDMCQNEPKIKYLTEGMLMREMMADPLLSAYSVIMLDEVHERTLFIDVIMGLMKKILKKRRSLKLIISSATLNAEFLRDFFNLKKTKEHSKDTSVIISVEGRQYPVEILYAMQPVADYVQETVNTVMKIHQTQKCGDILAFLTGQEEVDHAVKLLQSSSEIKSSVTKEKLIVLAMYGSLRHRDQLEVFKYPPNGYRKVVIATNIAESSITIPNIVYVVDCGFIKLRWFLPEAYMDSLMVVPVSKASANQRSGRAGRTRSGKAYRLYTEEDAQQLQTLVPPEMTRSDLMATVLYLKAMGIDNVLRFDFPSAPPAKNLLSALELLVALGAFDMNGSLTSPVGETMAEFSLDPFLSKLLLSSIDFDCVPEMLSIVAMLQVEDVFTKPATGKNIIAARMKRRAFDCEEGDFIALLNVYTAFMLSDKSTQFCSMNFINSNSMRKVIEIRKYLENMLSKRKLAENMSSSSTKSSVENLQKCITSAMFPNAAYLHSSGVYKSVRGTMDLHIHPNSVLYTLKQPQWVVFYQILHTSKTFMRHVTVIDKQWLINLAPHFYQISGEKKIN